MRYKDGLESAFSDDGVNWVMLVFCAPGTKEDYGLIQNFLLGMNLKPGEWKLCSDLKVYLIGNIERLPNKISYTGLRDLK